MDGFAISIIIITVILAIVAVGVFFFIREKRVAGSGKAAETEVIAITTMNTQPMTTQPSASMLNLVEKIEIANRSGQSFMLSRIDSSADLSTKKFQEITARGSAIGANLIQGAMPALAQAQTLSQIAKAAPNGLFTARDHFLN